MAKKNRKSGKNKKKGGGVRAKKRPTKSETEEAPTLVTETKTDAANATEAPPSGSASLAARADDNADSYDSVQLPPLITKYFGEVARDRDFLVDLKDEIERLLEFDRRTNFNCYESSGS